MRSSILAVLLISLFPAFADTPGSALPEATNIGPSDVFFIVQNGATKKIKQSTLTTNAPISTATNFSGTLTGDVTGTQGATMISTVGGQTAANVANGTFAANTATTANTASTIVKRDSSGNFSAGTITANAFTGTFTGNGAGITGILASGIAGIRTNYIAALISTNGYYTYATNADGTVLATLTLSNVPGGFVQGNVSSSTTATAATNAPDGNVIASLQNSTNSANTVYSNNPSGYQNAFQVTSTAASVAGAIVSPAIAGLNLGNASTANTNTMKVFAAINADAATSAATATTASRATNNADGVVFGNAATGNTNTMKVFAAINSDTVPATGVTAGALPVGVTVTSNNVLGKINAGQIDQLPSTNQFLVNNNATSTNQTLYIGAGTSEFVTGTNANGAELVITNSNTGAFSGFTAQTDKGNYTTNYLGVYVNNSRYVSLNGFSTNDGIIEYNSSGNLFHDFIGGGSEFWGYRSNTNASFVTNATFSPTAFNFALPIQQNGNQIVTNAYYTNATGVTVSGGQIAFGTNPFVGGGSSSSSSVTTNLPPTYFPQSFSVGNASQSKIPNQIWGQQTAPFFSLFFAPDYGFPSNGNGYETNIVSVVTNWSAQINLLTTNGVECAVQLDNGWDNGISNNAVTWKTNLYPHGIPWLNAFLVSNTLSGTIISMYGYNQAIPAGATRWMTDINGAPTSYYTNWSQSYTNTSGMLNGQVVSPQTMTNDVAAILSWGSVGVNFQEINGVNDFQRQQNYSAMICGEIVQQASVLKKRLYFIPYISSMSDPRSWGYPLTGFQNGMTYYNFATPVGRNSTNFFADFYGLQSMRNGAFINTLYNGGASGSAALPFWILSGFDISVDCRTSTNNIGNTISMLKKTDVQKIWKDSAYNLPFIAKDYGVGIGQVWAKRLLNGDFGLLWLNESSANNTWPTNFTWNNLGLDTNSSTQWQIKMVGLGDGTFADFSTGIITNSAGIMTNSQSGSTLVANSFGATLMLLHNPNTIGVVPSTTVSVDATMTSVVSTNANGTFNYALTAPSSGGSTFLTTNGNGLSSGSRSIQIGNTSISSGNDNVVIGYAAQDLGAGQSVAIGKQALGYFGGQSQSFVAVGYQSSGGYYSVALGNGAQASGGGFNSGCVALGYNTVASAQSSINIGSAGVNVSGANSIQIGALGAVNLTAAKTLRLWNGTTNGGFEHDGITGSFFAATNLVSPHFVGRTNNPPALTVNVSTSGAGTGATASLDANASDFSGTITLNSGTVVTGGTTLFTNTFGIGYQSIPHVVVSAANSSAAGLNGLTMIYVDASTGKFVFYVGATGLASSTTYKWSYIVAQ